MLAWALVGSIAVNCGGGGGGAVPGARDGVRDAERAAVVALPLGHWNAMGGNWSLTRVDFTIDTRLGTRSVGATWNSASASWRFSFEPSFDGVTFIDPSGARLDAAVADGEPLPGTHWVRLDATRIKTKGGLVHEFDATDGRLVAVRFASTPWPALRYVAAPSAGAQRTIRVEQCTHATSCQLVYEIERDGEGRVVGLTDRAGRHAAFDRDSDGRLTAARDPKDVAEAWPGQRYEYEGAQLAAVVNSEGERVELEFANARLTRLLQKGAGDPTWQMRYLPKAAEGPPTLFTSELADPLGHTVRFRFGADRRLRERENPLGETEAWDWVGSRPSRHIDRAGGVTEWVYTGDDLTQETLPSGNVRTFTYRRDAVDRGELGRTPLQTVSDSLGVVRTRAYDGAGRLVSETNGAGETTAFEWGADEALVRLIEPTGRETVFGGHGEHGHPTSIRRFGAEWSPVYDAVGNLERGHVAGPTDGGVLERRFDADRQIRELVLIDAPASGSATQQVLAIERRSDGAVTRIVRPSGGDTNVFYDAHGRENLRVEWVSPGAASAPIPRATVRSYDAAGQLVSVTRANGMHREVTRDAAGQVIGERYASGAIVESDVVYTIQQGRLLAVEDTARGFAETIAHDFAGRPVTRVHAGGEISRNAFDLRSRPIRRALETASGTLVQAVTVGYDAADRPERIGDGVRDLIAWTRSDGVIDRTDFGNGLVETATHYFGRVGGRDFHDAGGVLVAASLYGHTDADRLSAEYRYVVSGPAAGTASQSFLVDQPLRPERRVASSLDIGFVERRYAYDHVSNLTRSETPEHGSVDWGYNAERNRVLEGSRGGASFGSWTWDDAGFAIQRGGLALEWTARGALAVVTEIATAAERARFTYDPMGRRLTRTVNGVTVRWSHGGALELDAAGTPVAADLGPVRIGVNGARVYRHPDLRGNVAMRSDENGTIRSRQEYGPYGPIAESGDTDDIEHGFALGLELALDPELGPLYVMGARVYDPLIARFLAPDPVPQWANDFAYTQGNPVEFWDPTGRSAEGIHWERVGAWTTAIGGTLVTVAACAGAVGSGGVAALGCAGAFVATSGAWIQVHLIESELASVGVTPSPITAWEVADAIRFDPCTACVHIEDVATGPLSSGSGSGSGGTRAIFLEL